MTHLPPPVPQPVPAQPIGYRDDADVSGPWLGFVRIVAGIGLVAASASIAQVLLTLMSEFGLPQLLPTGIRFTVPRLLMAVPAALLLAGSIACLSLRPAGRRLMIAYTFAALVMVVLNFGFTAMQMLGRGMGAGSSGAKGYVLLSVLSSANAAAFPVAVLALMRQPPVQRIFDRR